MRRARGLDQSLLNLLRWGVRRFLLFLGAAAVALPVIFLRAGMEPRQYQLPAFDWQAYAVSLRNYLGNLAHGSFGYTYRQLGGPGSARQISPDGTPIARLLAESLPESLTLFFSALLLGLAAGLLLGLLASRFGTARTRGAAAVTNLALLSIPDLLLVITVQVALYTAAIALGFDLRSSTAELLGAMSLRQMVLPVLLLSLYPAAYAARVSVTAFDEIFGADYIRTAHAKGVSDRRVVWGHAFRNALLPLLGALPVITGLMISNLIMIEFLLNIYGVGRGLAYELLGRADRFGVEFIPYPSPEYLASVALCFAGLIVLMDGLADLLLHRLDPRIEAASANRHGQGKGKRRRKISPGGLREAGTRLLEQLRGLRLPTPPTLREMFRLPDPGRLRASLSALRNLFRANRPLTVGAIIVGLLLVTALAAPLLRDPAGLGGRIVRIVGREYTVPPFPPSADFPLGSDEYGRDLLTLVIYGTRYTVLIAGLVMLLRLGIALPLGLAAGWLQGGWERWVQRLSAVMGTIPTLLIPVVLIPVLYPAAVRGQGNATPVAPGTVLLWHLLILVAIGWPRLAESVRILTRELSARPFVEGAIAVGAGPGRIMRRHILPHLWPQLIVIAAAEMAWVLMLMAQLAVFSLFLGGASYSPQTVGTLVPNLPNWGGLLGRPVRYLYANQWVMLVPATAFFLAILGFHLLAEGARRVVQRTPAVLSDQPAGQAARSA